MAEPTQRKEFYPRPIDVPGLDKKGLNYRDVGDGLAVVAFYERGQLRVYRDLCPHMGASMSEGYYDPRRSTLSCPWHGMKFDAATGAACLNPNDEIFGCMKGLYSSYKPEKRPQYRLQAFEYSLEGAAAWIRRPGS